MKITRVESFLVEVRRSIPSRPIITISTGVVHQVAVGPIGIVGWDIGWGETPQRYLGDQLTGREADSLRDMLVGKEPDGDRGDVWPIGGSMVITCRVRSRWRCGTSWGKFAASPFSAARRLSPHRDRISGVLGNSSARTNGGDRPTVRRDGVYNAENKSRARSSGGFDIRAGHSRRGR